MVGSEARRGMAAARSVKPPDAPPMRIARFLGEGVGGMVMVTVTVWEERC